MQINFIHTESYLSFIISSLCICTRGVYMHFSIPSNTIYGRETEKIMNNVYEER